MEFFEEINKIIAEENVCFHMPGHASARLFSELACDEIIKNIYKIDTTEIEGTDNLHNPIGPIKDLQEKISDLYGVNQSMILVNGSTAGIEAAISAVVGENEKIIIDRACHQSVFNGLIFTGALPIYIDSAIRRKGIHVGVRTDKALAAIESNKDAKAIVLTSPTYYGKVIDIKKIAESAHKYGMIVIVDEAHGAHLNFSDLLPKSATKLGADIVIQSLHKTLPALTQTSVIHVCSDEIDARALKDALRIFETSSPSYILMASAELALNIAEKFGKQRIAKILAYIEELKKVCEIMGYSVELGDDKMRVFISAEKFGLNGKNFEKLLREKYKINVEMSNFDGVLLLVTMANNAEDFEYLTLVLANIKELATSKDCYTKSGGSSEFIERLLPNIKKVQVMTYRQAYFSKKDWLDVDKLAGKICARPIVPYPPGIPMVLPGEVFQVEHIAIIKDYIKNGFQILGIEDFKGQIVCEGDEINVK